MVLTAGLWLDGAASIAPALVPPTLGFVRTALLVSDVPMFELFIELEREEELMPEAPVVVLERLVEPLR